MIRGDATKGQKRGIALNSANTFVRNSYIGGIRLSGQETQAIAGWNGPVPSCIENNYLEAAGIGILFGGAEPAHRSAGADRHRHPPQPHHAAGRVARRRRGW